MGSEPKASLLSQWSPAWEVPNLVITHGGPFA